VAILGIVSKEAHVKSHAAALEQDGFEVRLLGGSPISFPMSLDAIIVRIASSSHGGVDQARKYAKTRNIPLVEADGLTGIRAKLRSIFPDASLQKDGWSMEPPVPTAKVLMDLNTKICKSLLDPVDADSEVKNLLGQMPIGLFFKRAYQALEDKMASLPPKKDFWSLWCSMHVNTRHDSDDWKYLGALYDAGKHLYALNNASRQVIVDYLKVCDDVFSKHGGKTVTPPNEVLPLANEAKLFTSVCIMLTEPRSLRRRAFSNAYKFLCGSQLDPKFLAAILTASNYEFIPRDQAESAPDLGATPEVVSPQIEAASHKKDLSNLIQDEVLNLSIRLEDAEKTSLNTDKALASANQAVSRLEAQLSEALTEIKALRGEVDSLRTKGAAQPTAAVSTTDQALAVLKRLGAKVVLSFDP
jgi:hypothetical protein